MLDLRNLEEESSDIKELVISLDDLVSYFPFKINKNSLYTNMYKPRQLKFY